MSYKRKRNRQITRIVGSLIGIVLVFTFVLSLLNIDSANNNSPDDFPTVTPYGTPVPLPTNTPVIIPTPNPDPQLVSGPVYVHGSGYFQAIQPVGEDWIVNENPGGASTFASVAIQNLKWLAVILHEVQPGVEYETFDSLSENYLTTAYFANVWSEYDSWRETGRTVTGNAVTVDFALVLTENDYLGQTIMWLDNGWLYSTRLVTPANNPDLLALLADRALSAFKGYHDLQDLPQTWPVYLDRELGYLIKRPSYWRALAGDVGRPVTFSSSPENAAQRVRIWTEPDRPLASEEDVTAWLAKADPVREPLAITETVRETGSGYTVAYTYRDTKGDPHSGLITLLNDAAGTLYAADFQAESPGINLLDEIEGLSALDIEARNAVANGFMILPPEARADSTR
ncbi:MAG: hypothetical protein JXQ72_17210 [Anaerolineae bacterium]|nr:hypothetical protein [Anaerolineae bacterium]